MKKLTAKNFFDTATGNVIVLVSCFCLLFIILIWTQIIAQLQTDKQQTIESAVQRNANLAVSLEQYTIRTIRNADAVLQLVKKEYEEKGGKVDFTALFGKGIIDLAYFNGVAIIDEKGMLQSSNIKLLNKANDFSDRKYFHFHQKYKDSLHISHPLLSRSIGKAAIVLSRRLNDSSGRFKGVIALQIEPSTFTQFYAKANLRTHDIISLVSTEGITYARRTGNKESHGENISKSPLYVHVVNKPVDNYFAKDAIRNIPTRFSYRKLEHYPMIATVGSAEKDILSVYYTRAKRDYAFGITLSVLLIMFSYLVCTFFIDRRKHVRTIKNNEARYRSIFENSLDAIILVNANGDLEAINNAAYSIFHIEKSNVPISTAELFFSATPHFSFTPGDLQKVASSKPEIEFTRYDDTQFIGELVHSTYSDAEGNTKYIVLVRDITLRKQMEQRLILEQKRYQRKLTKQIILAQEREREVIGHELHDNVNQILTTVKLFLEIAKNNPDMREELLPKSIYHIQECISEIRNLSHELSSPTLGTRSLIDSVKALVDMVNSSGQFKVCFCYKEYHTPVQKDQMLAIYRILQEQLNNIIKHANATEVHICLVQHNEQTKLTIKDNGRGFRIEEQRGGIGFNNMKSRAKVFGGQIKVSSAPGKGCTVTVQLPLMASEENSVKV